MTTALVDCISQPSALFSSEVGFFLIQKYLLNIQLRLFSWKSANLSVELSPYFRA